MMQVNTRQDIDITQTKRIYCREWRIQHRSVRATVSLPRLQLVKPGGRRPIFECPVCYSCNDKVPICFWCKSTSVESETAFWSSMPKQRTISAPIKLVSIPFEQPMTTTKITAMAMTTTTTSSSGTALPPLLDVPVVVPVSSNGRNEKLYQNSFVPPPPLNSSTDGAVSARSSVRKRRTSYNSTNTTTNTICTTTTTSSSDTTPETTLDSFSFPAPAPPLLPRHKRVNDIGRVTIVNNTILLQERDRGQDAAQTQTHARYHSLPLRRKGHFAHTTTGMIVKKTRLSALFRKDAVPMLDTHAPLVEPSLLPAHSHSTTTNVRPRREKLKIRTEEDFHQHHQHHIPSSSSKRSHLKAMPAIQNTSSSTSVHTRPVPVPVPLSYAQSSGTYTTTATSNDTGYYTMPTPPSFLSPFWYHADQYGNLPSSPTSTSSPVTVASSSNSPRPSHSYSRSEPFPMFPTQQPQQQQQQQQQQGSSRKWKSRMGGFFRTSINVVYGRHSR